MAGVRWENATARFFLDGVDQGTIFGTDLDVSTDLMTDKVKHMGREVPDIDASYNGGSGTITIDEQSGRVNVEQMLDRHEQGIKERDGTGEIAILVSKRHSDGTVVSYRFGKCIVTRNNSGSQNQRFSHRLSFEFENQEPI